MVGIPTHAIDVICTLALVATCILLAGCGGGDAEPDLATPSVDCAAKPELCK